MIAFNESYINDGDTNNKHKHFTIPLPHLNKYIKQPYHDQSHLT
jgi:hypothetical protein